MFRNSPGHHQFVEHLGHIGRPYAAGSPDLQALPRISIHDCQQSHPSAMLRSQLALLQGTQLCPRRWPRWSPRRPGPARVARGLQRILLDALKATGFTSPAQIMFVGDNRLTDVRQARRFRVKAEWVRRGPQCPVGLQPDGQHHQRCHRGAKYCQPSPKAWSPMDRVCLQ